MTLVDILKNSVEKYRDRPAVIIQPRYRTIRWTYGNLYIYALGIAKLLEKEGVKPGDRVLLWSPNSPYWVGTFFGILLRGGVVVPIHVENTLEFIEKVAKETEARLILKSYGLKSKFPELKAIDIDMLSNDAGSDLQPFPQTSPPLTSALIQPSENDLAEIIYTSGTTGEPKGVMLTHKNIFSNIAAISQAVPMGSNDRLISILPLSHMFEQAVGMLFPISRGARIIYLPRVSSGIISKTLQEHRATKLLAVPQFLDVVMKKIEARAREEGREKILRFARRAAEHLPFGARRLLFRKVLKRFGGKLATVASGGAPLDPILEKKWELLGIRLLQGYGLTETSPIVSANTYREHRFSSVGKPLEGVQVKIASDGEILIRGPNIFGGYYKNEEKTREAFTADGWFRSGDIGELDKDGFLYIRSRKKYMIKGPAAQNIYPEDIEFELAKQPGLKDSAVVGLEKDRRVEIHAVLLLEENADPESIVEGANKKLASFQKIQNYSVWPEADFPRSATRKIRKEKVLEWLKKTRIAEPWTLPHRATPLTTLLGQIFEKDPYAIYPEMKLVKDLGMDSILRIELVTRIEETLGVKIEERSLDHQTTVKDLEKLIQKTPHPQKPKIVLKNWPFYGLSRLIRELGWRIITLPLLSLFTRTRIFNRAVLAKLHGPALFMPNHLSYLDSIMVLKALPGRIRKRLAFAAATDVMKKYWWSAFLLRLFYMAFPFPRKENENIEPGLEAVGKLLDRGWSVVIYPEGKISTTGELLPLKHGAGLLGVEMEAPIIPIFLKGTDYVLPPYKIIPRRCGEVKIYFGEPLYFKKTDNYIEVTQRIEEALQNIEVSLQ